MTTLYVDNEFHIKEKAAEAASVEMRGFSRSERDGPTSLT